MLPWCLWVCAWEVEGAGVGGLDAAGVGGLRSIGDSIGDLVASVAAFAAVVEMASLGAGAAMVVGRTCGVR